MPSRSLASTPGEHCKQLISSQPSHDSYTDGSNLSLSQHTQHKIIPQHTIIHSADPSTCRPENNNDEDYEKEASSSAPDSRSFLSKQSSLPTGVMTKLQKSFRRPGQMLRKMSFKRTPSQQSLTSPAKPKPAQPDSCEVLDENEEDDNCSRTPECARRIQKRMPEFEGLSRVYLSQMNLTALPDAFANLTSLTTLALDQNKFRTIPRPVTKLKNLVVCYLNDNKIEDIPASVRHMSKLRYFWLQNNKIHTLPLYLLTLPELRYLHVENNRVRGIPNEIDLAVQLKGLWLSNNFIEKVPESILNCHGLETLHIDRNNIPSVPGALSQMPNLKDLVLSTKPKPGRDSLSHFTSRKPQPRPGLIRPGHGRTSSSSSASGAHRINRMSNSSVHSHSSRYQD